MQIDVLKIGSYFNSKDQCLKYTMFKSMYIHIYLSAQHSRQII